MIGDALTTEQHGTPDADQAPRLVFHAGDAADGDMCVDLERLVISRMLIQANSGGGKSWALRYLLEQTHGTIQQFVFDPEGEFSSLRERFPYVLIGRDGDLAAVPDRAGVLCRRLMELQASAVFDLYDLPLSERRRFVRVFLEELIDLPRLLWHPLLVVIDECHIFAPERSAGEAESTDAVIALATRGRKRPFALVLATQRIAKLHKDAAADLLNKLIGRTELDVDVTRAAGHLGFDRQRRATLPHLEPGMFYAYGPAISRRPVLVRTGAVQTTHPAPGAIVPPAPPPPIEMRALLAQLADLPTPESLVADDQARARARIAELEGRLERALAERPPERVVEYLPIIPDGQLDQLGSIADRLAAAAESAAHAATAIRDAVAAAQATPSLAPAVEPAHAPPGDAIDDIVDWDRLLDLPAVAAKIAQAGLTDGAGGYVPRVLRACLIAPLSPDELAEAWGLRGKSTQGRVRRAAQALITVRLLADTGDGRLAVNRGELERLGLLAAMVGEAGAARVPKER